MFIKYIILKKCRVMVFQQWQKVISQQPVATSLWRRTLLGWDALLKIKKKYNKNRINTK